jgi:hypothetical protein
MSCQQITTGVESFSFVKVYKSNITGTGLNGYQFFLQGHETIYSDMCGTTITSHHWFLLWKYTKYYHWNRGKWILLLPAGASDHQHWHVWWNYHGVLPLISSVPSPGYRIVSEYINPRTEFLSQHHQHQREDSAMIKLTQQNPKEKKTKEMRKEE